MLALAILCCTRAVVPATTYCLPLLIWIFFDLGWAKTGWVPTAEYLIFWNPAVDDIYKRFIAAAFGVCRLVLGKYWACAIFWRGNPFPSLISSRFCYFLALDALLSFICFDCSLSISIDFAGCSDWESYTWAFLLILRSICCVGKLYWVARSSVIVWPTSIELAGFCDSGLFWSLKFGFI
jgi:hypothetical protein